MPLPILMDNKGQAIDPDKISNKIEKFGNSYNNPVKKIIAKSKKLDKDGKEFFECATLILTKFGMARSGPFHEKNRDKNLRRCWDEAGAGLLEINKLVLNSDLSRDRYLLELNDKEREELIVKIWFLTKKLLPITMSKSSYGLVGASKILFSVLPEIALPVDNTEWLQVFKTVDLGDVLCYMVSDIQNWESQTGRPLNELDRSKRLTTLPSVYNVMAMAARPKTYTKPARE